MLQDPETLRRRFAVLEATELPALRALNADGASPQAVSQDARRLGAYLSGLADSNNVMPLLESKVRPGCYPSIELYRQTGADNLPITVTLGFQYSGNYDIMGAEVKIIHGSERLTPSALVRHHGVKAEDVINSSEAAVRAEIEKAKRVLGER
jgi:hypothetical protein